MRSALVVALAVLGGCVEPGEPVDPEHAGTPEEAEQIAQAWLEAVSDESGDRGWSLLHPLSQERLYDGDSNRYTADVRSVDWRHFEWEFGPAVWDGNYLVLVTLPQGTQPAADLADGHLMQPIQGGSADEPQAAIAVRIDFDGSRGVLGP